MKFYDIFNQIMVLFFIMIVGFYARKKKIINAEINKGLTELLLNITLPAMIITSFNLEFSGDMLKKSGEVLLWTLGLFILYYIIGMIFFGRYPKAISSVLIFSAMFSNCGFMGFPVIESIFGKEGVFYASIYHMPFSILLWTVGVSLFSKEKDKSAMKKAFLNPGSVSIYIGLILFLFSIKLPIPLGKTLDMLGDVTTPLSMIVVGAILGEMNIKEVFSSFPAYYSSIIRLILIPFVVMGVLKLAGVSGITLGVLVMLSAMPVAANTAIISSKYGADSVFASKCIFISTVLSTLTIPLLMLFMV